jgi:hypothetical protein
MTAVTFQLVQQVIIPAYVWQDEAQRTAVLVKAAQTLLMRAEAEQQTIVGDIADAVIVPSFLKAQVGQTNGVRFVAYEVCEPGMADLVFVQLVQNAEAKT